MDGYGETGWVRWEKGGPAGYSRVGCQETEVDKLQTTSHAGLQNHTGGNQDWFDCQISHNVPLGLHTSVS